jgi:RNA polymerase-interacting CarD/CdnL/TRCF family regulator
MNMTGYIPTDDDIAAMVRDLEKNDPENANPEYARQMLIKMKLMYRELGKIDEELLLEEMEAFKTRPTEQN